MKQHRVVAALLLLVITACASVPQHPLMPAPESDEFQIQSTVLAAYNVISGPAGRRDWNRMKALFIAGGTLSSISMKDGVLTTTVSTPDEYQAKVQPYFAEHGFFEQPIHTRIDRYGDIAHVFSTYESRNASNDPQPFARGVNSFELVRNGDHWSITSILWEQEDAAHPIPAAFLPPR